ncbi:BZ3500_MvSof-1268-A1-R1_Chr8-1g09855 [Microbotryum saponariae]|uniref:BZ3500_MvSof-1268-A1-R1_Chr8-1g09855 protein n=1 Tax=Microbotryum saponariae TaxID=289078 RepID=A0A2X0LLW5_9BASI|nr:BZ3500_MvSof-1268-A1-R1_Chr8-1g09855 [Microbotryum saponariae]SDA08141.1 BZ3501_MvSof-1269-A2-R1_Chr8-1g09578 [Microbotryum saponariae]
MQAPQQGGAPAQQGTGGDALDKGVDAVLKKAGKGQSASTTEKISDGVRTGFKKLTGKDVPVQDKPMA